jgi:hypothetical protein
MRPSKAFGFESPVTERASEAFKRREIDNASANSASYAGRCAVTFPLR